MNKLSVTINANIPFCETASSHNGEYSFGLFNLSVNRIHISPYDEKPFYWDAQAKIFCCLLGYISNVGTIKARHGINAVTDVEIVAGLYARKGPDFIQEMDGIFVAFIYDSAKQKCFFVQSRFGMSLPLYYTFRAPLFIFSTSLKQVLKHIPPSERTLNVAAVRDFIAFKVCIPNKQTLVKHVFKIMPQQYYSVDLGKQALEVKRQMTRTEPLCESEAKRTLLGTIKDNMLKLGSYVAGRRVAITLTGGYDSNLLLHFLRECREKEIYAVTVNGGQSVDETVAAQNILEHYSNVKHIRLQIERDSITSLANTVWRYEGCICEDGMFLRRQLAQALHRDGFKSVVLGSCADQIINPRIGSNFTSPINGFKSRMKRKVNFLKQKSFVGRLYLRHAKKVGVDFLFRLDFLKVFSEVSCNLGFEYILKMHEIILNSYGIQGLYPFVNNETVAAAKSLSRCNREKAFYKAQVSDLLGDEISRHLKKSGKVVDLRGLSWDGVGLSGEVLSSDFAKQILSSAQIRRLLRSPEKYSEIILQTAYLYYFSELFISGRFDAFFDREEDVPRHDALKTPLEN